MLYTCNMWINKCVCKSIVNSYVCMLGMVNNN